VVTAEAPPPNPSSGVPSTFTLHCSLLGAAFLQGMLVASGEGEARRRTVGGQRLLLWGVVFIFTAAFLWVVGKSL
jgi:hypothetical protein